jgi:hypothetical protein
MKSKSGNFFRPPNFLRKRVQIMHLLMVGLGLKYMEIERWIKVDHKTVKKVRNA